jgi:hypothetical protein
MVAASALDYKHVGRRNLNQILKNKNVNYICMWYVFSFLVKNKKKSITNLKFQHKPKYHLFKILISKQTYYYLGAKIP